MRTRALALGAGLLLALPAAPASGAVDSFSWGFTRAGSGDALALHVVDNELGTASQVVGFKATFPAGMKASGSPQVVGDSNWFCDTDLGGLGCTNTGGGGLAPGNSLDVTGFSVSPTMPDGGGSQVQFQVQHPGDPFTDAGVGSGPPDPCPQAAPPAHVPPNPGSTRDPLARFITQVYRDLLGRAPTKTEISYFHSLLKSGALTRDQVVLPILSSPEYRTSLVNQFYKDFLRRKPGANEVSFGVSQLGAHSDEALKAVIMGSAEYFTKCAHGDNTSFIQHAFRDLLGREPTTSEVAFLKSKLTGGATRGDVITGLVSSDEYFSRLVRQSYKDLLNRNPTAAELAAGKKTVKSTSGEQLKANLMGSAEYFFGRAGVTEYFDNPRVKLSKNRVRVKMLRKATFELLVERVKGHTTLKGTRIKIPTLKRVGVVSFGELGKGQRRRGWNGTIKGRQLAPGNYVVVPIAVDGGGHLLYITAPAALKVKEKGNRI